MPTQATPTTKEITKKDLPPDVVFEEPPKEAESVTEEPEGGEVEQSLQKFIQAMVGPLLFKIEAMLASEKKTRITQNQENKTKLEAYDAAQKALQIAVESLIAAQTQQSTMLHTIAARLESLEKTLKQSLTDTTTKELNSLKTSLEQTLNEIGKKFVELKFTQPAISAKKG